MRKAMVAAVAIGLSGAVSAQEADVPVETNKTATALITLKLYPFLTKEETQLLRIMATNEQALAVLVPEGGGYGAIAIAPKEGFVRDGAPVPSAVAVAQFPDAAAAAADALGKCEAAKKRGPDCVVVLEVAPL